MKRMTTIAGHQRRQTDYSNILMKLDMTSGALFGGLLAASLLAGYLPGAIAGWLLCAAGKGLCLIADLGRPERFLLAFSRPTQSWISIGGLGFFALCALGFFYCVACLVGAPQLVVDVLAVLAFAGCCMTVSYEGFTFNHSLGVPAWRSEVMAVLFAASAFLSGLGLLGIALFAGGTSIAAYGWMAPANLMLLLTQLGALFCYLLNLGTTDSETKLVREELLHGPRSVAFVGIIGVLGTAVPIVAWVLAWAGFGIGDELLLAACCMQVLATAVMRFLLLDLGTFRELFAE